MVYFILAGKCVYYMNGYKSLDKNHSRATYFQHIDLNSGAELQEEDIYQIQQIFKCLNNFNFDEDSNEINQLFSTIKYILDNVGDNLPMFLQLDICSLIVNFFKYSNSIFIQTVSAQLIMNLTSYESKYCIEFQKYKMLEIVSEMIKTSSKPYLTCNLLQIIINNISDKNEIISQTALKLFPLNVIISLSNMFNFLVSNSNHSFTIEDLVFRWLKCIYTIVIEISITIEESESLLNELSKYFSEIQNFPDSHEYFCWILYTLIKRKTLNSEIFHNLCYPAFIHPMIHIDNKYKSQAALLLFCSLYQNNLLNFNCSPLEFVELSIEGLKEPRNLEKFTMCLYILCIFLKKQKQNTLNIFIEQNIMNKYIDIFHQEAFEIKKEICNLANEYILCCLELKRYNLITEQVKEVLCYTLQIDSKDGEFTRTVNTILLILKYTNLYCSEEEFKANVDWFVHHNVCELIESYLNDNEPNENIKQLIEVISYCYE